MYGSLELSNFDRIEQRLGNWHPEPDSETKTYWNSCSTSGGLGWSARFFHGYSAGTTAVTSDPSPLEITPCTQQQRLEPHRGNHQRQDPDYLVCETHLPQRPLQTLDHSPKRSIDYIRHSLSGISPAELSFTNLSLDYIVAQWHELENKHPHDDRKAPAHAGAFSPVRVTIVTSWTLHQEV